MKMPKKLLTLFLPAIVMSFNSSVSVADENYPAADFKPSVIYLDKAYQETGNEKTQMTKKRLSSKPDANYPAANFEPKVVYLDEKYASKANSSARIKRETSKPDPKYPAANFEPKVIYP